ncbi:MAG: hypothetical protein QM601_03915 [Pseudoxanthomonas sp.]
MKLPTLLLTATLALAACQREASAPNPARDAALPAPVARPPADLVDALARDPERLKAVRAECRENRPDRDEELCVASALAVRQRMLGERKKPSASKQE